ncbi:hypothetical protein GWN63_05050, partial [Candidatus Bathyarchaeota archaeon]|nr:hypothetical protein [Candidatus Bathyarchaeota archaeon]NIU81593.1 hypothetical protein [Candidatus Bathyarchaeota archaeon]NIV68238.1 hypothetical protein [Candidatus Bathyarchaeota archaeon]NIW15986.1 hypothetical protein [Candidatus Bathyarchaeota archaeon]NIW34763.1 hypothetical protein [Candidatus Bathyarchaeota archaeon]
MEIPPGRKLNKIAKCEYCGKDVILPFRCPYCEQSFCPEHRLPENHSCPEHWRARAPGPQPPPIVPQEKRYEYSVSYTPRLGTTFQFSHKELEHLAIGALLVTGVGLSFIPQAVGMPPLTNLEILVPLIVIFTL